MKFKEFVEWCNYRACDGCWGTYDAMICIAVIQDIRKKPFWKRNKEWKKMEDEIVTKIVDPINKKIKSRI